jgi:uncharacterized protein (TIGR00288 family)
MSPWWLRPTSDGAEENKSENDETLPPTTSDPTSAEAAADNAALFPEPVRFPEPERRPFGPADALPDIPAEDFEEESWNDAGEAAEMLEAGEEGALEDTPDANGNALPGEEGERPGRRRRRGGRGRRRGTGTAAAAAPAREAEEAPEPPSRPRRAERAERADRAQRPQIAELPPVDFQAMSQIPREIYMTAERPHQASDERKIALFCDLENIALGVRDSEVKKFDIELALERLLEKGKIIVKKAYADWERYSDYKRPFHEAAIELIDIPQKYYSGKNSADIKMVVDAMDLCYAKEHLDTFVILSGDSDFSPLVSKLKENNKYVIGVGVKNSSSNLLVDNCDEFIYYEDVWRDQHKPAALEGFSKKHAEVFGLMIDSIQALKRENKDVLWGSMIKQTMQRKKPSFNEGYYGYSTFSELLEDAERKGIVKLRKDQRSGTYVVTGFAARK